MGLGNLTRDGVLAAVKECQRLGRDDFLRAYDFGRATRYELVLDGARYDSKAIAGVGHKYSTGTLLTPQDFSGGAHTVARRLRALGFTVEDGTTTSKASELSGVQLVLQPRGGAKVRGQRNFAKSVRRGVGLEELGQVLGEQAEVLRALYPDGVARLWGSTPSSQVNNPKAKALSNRRVGDHVLFYAENQFIARARVCHIFNSAPLAKAVWGTDENGATWEHIMALSDVEEFSTPVKAAPILQSLNVPIPLRSLTLRSAEDYRRVAHMLPGQQSSEPLASSALTMTATDLLQLVGTLRTHRNTGADAPSRHQPLTLLWAISRVAANEQRLVSWSQFRAEVGQLLADFGLPHSKVTPEYPFWHLQRSDLWEVHGIPDDSVTMPQIGVFNALQPTAGLTSSATELLRDPAIRLDAVVKLCGTYFEDVDQHALLHRVGLGGYATADGSLTWPEDDADHEPRDERRIFGPAARRESTSFLPVRNTALAKRVKELHRHTCQVCGFCLQFLRGSYGQAAHIRGLGSPHNGPDELFNLLCLCPNHHSLFDGLEIYIDDDDAVKWTYSDEPLGQLSRHPDHPIDEAHIRYHRTLCKLNA